jgi:uridine phosphorylase
MTSGWVVFLLGSPLPFEEMATYRARIKRERFDLDMLNRYCEALGIARSNDRFYGQHAVLHSVRGSARMHPNYPTAAAWRAVHLSSEES